MARPALNANQKQDILQAKQLLRTLWRQSGLKQQDLLAALSDQGQPIRKNTLSNWLSETDLKRPDPEALGPLLRALCPQPGFALQMQQELERLFGYETAPVSSDGVLNQLAGRLAAQPDNPLLSMLYELEERIFVYDRTYPVLRIESDDKERLKLVLGKDKNLYQKYRVSSGYEIPLSQLQVPELLTDIIDSLHAGVRVLRAYLETHLLMTAAVPADYPLFEELLAYIWEIVNRLLFNPVCREQAAMKTPLLSIVGACQGIRYLLESQRGQPSLVAFENVLQLKGMTSREEIRCAMAVYVGVIARQLLSSAQTRPELLARGQYHAREALKMLVQSHQLIADERARYFYKKEIANLSYDAATLLLWLPEQRNESVALMTQAHRYYGEVLEGENLFRAGLNPERMGYLQAFYTISSAWCCSRFEDCLSRLGKLAAEPAASEQIRWLHHLAEAIACGILHFRFDRQPAFLQRATRALQRAGDIPGMDGELAREIRQDYVLSRLLPRLGEVLENLQPGGQFPQMSE